MSDALLTGRVAARHLWAGLSNLKPNEKVRVYHGTQLVFAEKMVNGFDANKVVHRTYSSNGNRHAGIFVSPSVQLARHFSSGGELVLEFEVQAKNLHGTNYGGNIGRAQQMDSETQEWIRDSYPESFRPYLSMTLLQKTEPQALLRGLVKPSQIKRVEYKGKWYSRKEFLELGVEVYRPYGKGKGIRDIGYDLSYPNYSLPELFEAVAASEGITSDRAESTLLRRAKLPHPRSEKALGDLLEAIGFGPTAIKSYTKKLLEEVGASPARVASRYAATTPLPPLTAGEPGLLTQEEYLDLRNPQDRHHDSDSYDWTLAKMNREYFDHLGSAGREYEVYQGKKGVIIRNGDLDLVGVLSKGTLYYSNPTLKSKLPDYYRSKSERGVVDLGVENRKQVKYLAEVMPLVSSLAEDTLGKYPVLLQNLKLKGRPFTLRAAGTPIPGKGTTLAILNEEGQVVAQASNEWGATLLVVAQEYRGQGLGGILGRFWYDFNPEHQSGGYTTAGRDNAVRMWEARVREFLSRGWYSQLLREGKIDNARVDLILSDLEGRKPRHKLVPDRAAKPAKKDLRLYVDDPTFVLYDARFLEDPQAENAEDYIYGFGFFRSSSPVGSFLFTIDYDRSHEKVVTLAALQMARDNGEPIYVGEGYGDLLEWEGIPSVEKEGDYIEMTRDALPLAQLGKEERRARRKVDPYGEAEALLLEKAESKWK